MGNPHCDSSSSLSSSNVYCGEIDMFAVWESFFCMIAFVVIVLIPFATFYYEAGDVLDVNNPVQKSRFWPAFFQECVLTFGFLLILLVLYFLKANSEIPVQHVSVKSNSLMEQTYVRTSSDESPYDYLQLVLPASEFSTSVGQTNTSAVQYSSTTISVPVDFPVYLIGLFGWFGWWVFAIFVGVGLAALPFDLIVDFIYRPRILPPDVLANKELELQERTKDILEIVNLLKKERMNYHDSSSNSRSILRKRYVKDRIEVNRLTQMVFLLEKDVEDFRLCKNIRHSYNPLIPYVKLGCGVFFSLLSILWLLQIILSVLTDPSVTPFLSLYLISFDTFFPMFGNLTYAMFALYLLLCTVKGCFKLSVRSLCCKVHPMLIGGTYINSFLFNLGIVMFCTIPLVHFCVLAFKAYTVDTDAFLLFIVEIGNLHFFRTFYSGNNVFIWIILVVACMVFLYLLRYPRDQAMNTEDFRKNLFHKIDSGEKQLEKAKSERKSKKGGWGFALVRSKDDEVNL
jgi:LMBR1 domain-containing protein 1